MATFNGEKFLCEQLDSLAAQSVLPCELVMTDDGSVDRTIEIARNFARTSPFPVRIFENSERLGYADNFFRAASLCQGDWIAFCDQDDIWTSEKIEVCSTLLANKNVFLISHNFSLIDENGSELQEKITYFRIRSVKSEKKYWRVYLGFTVTFKRDQMMKYIEALEIRPFQRFGIPHDQFVVFIAATIGKVAGSNQFLAKYRRHGQNVSFYPPFGEKRAKIYGLQVAYHALRQRSSLLYCLNKIVAIEDKLDRQFVLATALYLRRRIVLYKCDKSFIKRFNWLVRSILLGTYSNKARKGLTWRALVLDLYGLLWSILIRVKANKGSPIT